jgi:cellulose biosynthesis protein BcsQ
VDGDTSSRFDENFSVRESVDGDTSSRFDENFSVLGDEQMNEKEQVQCK